MHDRVANRKYKIEFIMHFPHTFNTSRLIFMQKLLATLLKRKSFYANIATEAETLD